MALQSSAIEDINTFLTRCFYIPNYQREYSWENDELDDFWNDLLYTMKDKEDIHFFGQVVVHDDQKTKKKYIIDGQQRTTTSMIFLRAMQVVYDDLYQKSKLKKTEYKKDDIESKFLGREDERHLILGATDNDFFENSILSALPGSTAKKKKKSNERLRKAYEYFNDKIRKNLLKDCSEYDEQLEKLNSVYETFTLRFKILYMEATKLEEAFVIFETLNARGRDLETSDLLKNYILNQSKDIDNSLKKWNSMIGKLDKCDPTKYIRNYWNATHDLTREKALYRVINKNISTPKKTKDLLNSLDDLALYYHDMVIPSEGSSYNEDIKQIFIALKTLKASTFYPVILAMETQSHFDEDDILAVLKSIECYVFRNFTIRGMTANSAETYFSSIAKSIYEENLSMSKDICKEIKKGIISDVEFKEAFTHWAGTKSSKETIRYILRRIHNYLDQANELNIDNTEVHIEHIMPEDNAKWNVDDDFHDEYLWRLGNLCLLSGTYNREISNSIFSKKRSVYLKSKIEPNKDIAQNKVWDAKAIESRQKYFANLALKIWKK